MAHENSPSATMYDELKNLGLKKYDAASLLLDGNRVFGDGTLHERIQSRTWLTRYIVQSAPGELSSMFFQDFAVSAPAVMGQIVSRMRKSGRSQAQADAAIAEKMVGESATAMKRALDRYGIDSAIYGNALAHVSNLKPISEADRTLLYLMLFLATGCTGNPREGVSEVERFLANRIGAGFRTTETSWDDTGLPESASPAPEQAINLGLMRIVDGKLKGGSLYRLSTGDLGTEIGAFASQESAITDVDGDVSRRHARIYRKDAHWYIIGLKSTNGTTVISGEDKRERIVEPPRRNRPRDYVPQPMEILPSDTICLGSSTRFLVMPLAD